MAIKILKIDPQIAFQVLLGESYTLPNKAFQKK
jgi:hypothetical protein